jgi:hypothetical protein
VDDWTARESELLKKLVEKAPAAGFSADEVALLRQVLDAYRGWAALGRATRFLVVSLALVAAAVAAWETLIGKLRTWLVGS